MTTVKPNFFIVGAPKCGTTALFEYLGTHPDIYMAKRKEIHYFGSDLTSKRYTRNLNQYLVNFSDWNEENRIGEASVWYMLSKVAAREIKAYSPDARIIIMLRNPIDVLYSHYYQMLYIGNENISSFEEALKAEADRRAGRRIPPNARLVQELGYREVVRFTEQVKRYFDVFGRESVHVIIFDDFVRDTAREYRHTLTFLGVDPNFQPDFRVVNPNKRTRSRRLYRFLTSQPELQRTIDRMLKVMPPLHTALKNFWRAAMVWNTQYFPRPPMNSELRRQLLTEFTPEIISLGQLLGRDLTHWGEE